MFIPDKTTKRGGGVKNCQFWDDIVYGRPPNGMAIMLVKNPSVYCEEEDYDNDVAMCFWWKALNWSIIAQTLVFTLHQSQNAEDL